MGVYISGLEIPPKGKGVVVILCSSGAVYLGGQKVGTAVPVPPHGRIVDADKLTEEMRLFIKENMLSRDDARELLETIAEAPTIIEAEDGET